jgi:hypothetical protein
MKQPRTIPTKDADFNVVQARIATTASTNRSAWMLDGEWLDKELLPKKKEWEDAYAAYENEGTRNSNIIFAQNEARKEYEKLLRILVKSLQSNIHVTPDNLHGIGGIVVPSSSRTPAPVAAMTYPDFDIDSKTFRHLSVHYYDQSEKKSKAKPAGQHGAEIRWAILDTPPASLADLINSSFNTRTPFTRSPVMKTSAAKAFISASAGKIRAARKDHGTKSFAQLFPE